MNLSKAGQSVDLTVFFSDSAIWRFSTLSHEWQHVATLTTHPDELVRCRPGSDKANLSRFAVQSLCLVHSVRFLTAKIIDWPSFAPAAALLLQKGADVNARDQDGLTALMEDRGDLCCGCLLAGCFYVGIWHRQHPPMPLPMRNIL